jgi:membrane-associated phospholipid phosphatase
VNIADDSANVVAREVRMSNWGRQVVCAAGCAVVLGLSPRVAAQSPAPEAPAAEGVSPKPRQSVIPRPELPPPRRSRYIADPFSDGAVLSVSLGMAVLSDLILSTGEITPQQPVQTTKLIAIDRGSLTAQPVAAWGTVSGIGLYAALAYAALDPVLSGYRNGVESGIVDGFIYAETISVTWAATNLAKIAFRRPRPSAYQEQARREASGGTSNPEDLSATNSAMSFFSGHASIVASVTGAATYLAFSRSSTPLRPWLTLGIGAAATTLVGIGRVKAGEHFPTDVIAGAMVGAGIGVLVPHLHREEPAKQRSVWIGLGPQPGGVSLQAYARM